MNQVHLFVVHSGGPLQTQHGTGSGGGDNTLDRIAKLEKSVEYIERDIGEIKDDTKEIKKHAREDFRVLFGAIILTALGIATILAKVFNWL